MIIKGMRHKASFNEAQATIDAMIQDGIAEYRNDDEYNKAVEKLTAEIELAKGLN